MRVAVIKLIIFGGGAGGKRNGSVEWDGKNWCGCDQFYLWKSQRMCWQGKMHLGTLEVSLRDFDEELCLGISRVCEDRRMIRLQDWTKMRTWLWKWENWLNCIWLGIFFAVKGRLPATPTSLKSIAFPLGLENFKKKEPVHLKVAHQLRSNNPFYDIGDECQVRSRTITLDIVRIKIIFLEDWRDDSCLMWFREQT